MATFTEALSGQKRKSQLAGQPLAKPGAIGVSGGGAEAVVDLSAGRARIEGRQRIEEKQRVEAERVRVETERLAEQKRQEEARVAAQAQLEKQQREAEAERRMQNLRANRAKKSGGK